MMMNDIDNEYLITKKSRPIMKIVMQCSEEQYGDDHDDDNDHGEVTTHNNLQCIILLMVRVFQLESKKQLIFII